MSYRLVNLISNLFAGSAERNTLTSASCKGTVNIYEVSTQWN